jgi:carbon starvation protein
MLKKIFWVSISLIAAFFLGAIAVNANEKVNALWIVIAALCIYVIAYRFYSAFLSSKVLALDSRRITPSVRLNDGVDYHPTNRWILLGHHFAAISGAGPIIGPTLAAQFGYMPGFLWLLIGAVLAGAVHDMVVLTASVRRNGHSLAQIIKDEVGPIAGISIAIIILFNIIVAVAGSGLAVVNALENSPWGTFSIILTIPIAMLMGVYLHSFRPGKINEVSIIGAGLLIGAVYFGHMIPGSFLAPYFIINKQYLIICLGILCFFSSVLPVWLLLLPRDYVSAYIKIGTFVLMLAGIAVTMPKIQMPAFTQFTAGGGPIVPGTLFPFLFITIACGAISGFHGLVASGTTPKMIKSELDIRTIGYGAMLIEGLVATISLIAATVLIPGDYFSINTKLTFEALSSMVFPVEKIKEISDSVGVNVAGRPGGSVSLAVGISSILSNLFGGRSLMAYFYNFALMFQAMFILTLVDTGTRVGRFLLQEIGGYISPSIAGRKTFLNIATTSLIIVSMWIYLISTGNISTIWPMFGVANQILAATALGAGTTFLIKSKNTRYVWVTLLPMVFMFVTTFIAAWQLVNIFLMKAAAATNSSDAMNLHIDAGAVIVMAVLAVVICADFFTRWYRFLVTKAEITSSEVIVYERRKLAERNTGQSRPLK